MSLPSPALARLRGLLATVGAHAQELRWMQEKVAKAANEAQRLWLLEDMVSARVHQRKPLQYVLGDVSFCGLTLRCEPPVLIPRPETEAMSFWLAERCFRSHAYSRASSGQFRIADLCSGSGAIALALTKHLPKASVVGVDVHPAALRLSESNARSAGLRNCRFVGIDLMQGVDSDAAAVRERLLAACGGPVDVVVSNPPYVEPEAWNTLQPEITRWEDKRALVAAGRGLAFYERFVQLMPDLLRVRDVLDARRDRAATEAAKTAASAAVGSATGSAGTSALPSGWPPEYILRSITASALHSVAPVGAGSSDTARPSGKAHEPAADPYLSHGLHPAVVLEFGAAWQGPAIVKLLADGFARTRPSSIMPQAAELASVAVAPRVHCDLSLLPRWVSMAP